MRGKSKSGQLIGTSKHKLFKLARTRGVIRGITALFKSDKHASIDALTDFDLLPEGETVSFEAPSVIEVMAFEAVALDVGHMPYLRRHVLEIEEGGSLSGPVVWRGLPDKEAKRETPVTSDEGSMLLSWIFAIVGFPLVFIAAMAAKIYLPGDYTIWGVLFLGYVFLLFLAFEGPKLLVKPKAVRGSVEIFAPERKIWKA